MLKKAVNVMVLLDVEVTNSSKNLRNNSYFCLILSLSDALYSFEVAASLSGNRLLLV